MNPDEMQAWLDKAVTLAKKGYAPEKIGAWLKSRTNGQFSSGQELSQAIVATRKGPVPPKFSEFQSAGRDQDAALLQGLTSKFSDEMLGVWAGARGGTQGYRAARDYEREAAKRGGSGAEMAGAVVQGLLTLPLATAGAGGYLANVGKTALAGGLLGGITGAGAAPEMADVLPEAAQGAGFGAALGGGAAAVLPPVMGLGRTGLGWLNTLRGKPSVLREMADRQIGSAVLGASPDAATALRPLDRAVELNLPMPIAADASSKATRLARRSINAAPDLTDMAHELTAARVGQRAPRLAEGLARETGVPESVASAMVRGAKKATEKAAKILYGPLNPQVLDEASGIPALIDELAAAHPEVGTQIARMAKRQPGEPLTFRTVNSIRMHLAEKGWTSRGIGKEHAIGDALVDAAERLDAGLAGAVPEYVGVRAKYKALMDVQRAYSQGAKSATKAMTDADLEAFNALSDEAKTAWRIGKQYAVTSKLRSGDPLKPSAAFQPITQATPLGETAGIGSPPREGWKQLFPAPEETANFDEMARLARRQAGTEQRLTGGSLTDQGLSDIGTDFAQQVAKTGASGEQSLAAGLVRKTLDALMLPQNEQMGAMVGRDLMAPYTTAARAELIRKMELAAAAKARKGLLNAQTIGALIGAGVNVRAQ